MRMPPIIAGVSANEMLSFGPYTRSRSDDTLVCKSAGRGVALSTVAVCRAQSSFTKRRKCDRKAKLPRCLIRGLAEQLGERDPHPEIHRRGTTDTGASLHFR